MRANSSGVWVWAVLALALSVSARPATAQEPPPTPAGDVGTVSGIVIDKSSRDPIIEAGVEVVGHGKTVRTDLDGKYSLRLPPGTYELRIYAPGYAGARLKEVTVKPGAVTKGDAILASAGAAGVDVVEVTATRKKAAEASQLAVRKEAATVKDVISRETMGKTTGSEASDIVQRAPAVTVKEDRFVFVRGLSERYTSALLNSSRLPSPDPLRRAVPLDLFPAEFLDSISITKTFSPDLPGDFSGGLVELDLRDLPDQLTYSLGVNTGANTQTTFQDFLTYKGTTADWFALGKSYRRPPESLPEFDVNDLPLGSRLSVARSFKDIWSPHTTTAPPNFGVNAAVGNRFGPFGFQFGALYSTEWVTRPNQIRRQFGQGGTPDDPIIAISEDLRADSGTFQAKLGGLLTAGYKPNENHELTLRSFVYQNAYDTTITQTGFLDQNPANPVRLSSLQYVQENLGYGQLAGKHKLTDWLRTDWRTVLSRTARDEPDTRFNQYIGTDTKPRVFQFSTNENRGGFRFNNETFEWLSDTMVDFTIPFKTQLPYTDVWDDLDAKFKFGPAYSYRSREFNQREFLYSPDGGAVDLTDPPQVILQPGNLVPGIVDFEELTDIEDSFNATQEIAAGYGLFELPIIRDQLRIIGGARVEYSLIRLDSGVIVTEPGLCPPGETECFRRFRKKNIDPLPGINAVWSPRFDMNVRASYGQSVARPEFRELAPARFPTPPGEREKRGNPDLVQTEITSWDLRWEWFFSPLELVSLGFFYKDLTLPIEQVTVIEGTDATDTWVNGSNATLYGFEFEGRKDFGFVNERLRPFSLLTNVTWSDSSVEVPPQNVGGLTTLQSSPARPLVGQSPFIINAGIEYNDPDHVTARLLYYTAARNISSAGFNGLDDIYFERRDQLDAVVMVPLKQWLDVPLTARLTAENLLNAPYVFTQGPVIQQKFTNGIKFTIGLSYVF